MVTRVQHAIIFHLSCQDGLDTKIHLCLVQILGTQLSIMEYFSRRWIFREKQQTQQMTGSEYFRVLWIRPKKVLRDHKNSEAFVRLTP
jgi:hypothetical protein